MPPSIVTRNCSSPALASIATTPCDREAPEPARRPGLRSKCGPSSHARAPPRSCTCRRSSD
jgi:hypothetical protein